MLKQSYYWSCSLMCHEGNFHYCHCPPPLVSTPVRCSVVKRQNHKCLGSIQQMNALCPPVPVRALWNNRGRGNKELGALGKFCRPPSHISCKFFFPVPSLTVSLWTHHWARKPGAIPQQPHSLRPCWAIPGLILDGAHHFFSGNTYFLSLNYP